MNDAMNDVIKTLLDEHCIWNENTNLGERVALALLLLERATNEVYELRSLTSVVATHEHESNEQEGRGVSGIGIDGTDGTLRTGIAAS